MRPDEPGELDPDGQARPKLTRGTPGVAPAGCEDPGDDFLDLPSGSASGDTSPEDEARAAAVIFGDVPRDELTFREIHGFDAPEDLDLNDPQDQLIALIHEKARAEDAAREQEDRKRIESLPLGDGEYRDEFVRRLSRVIPDLRERFAVLAAHDRAGSFDNEWQLERDDAAAEQTEAEYRAEGLEPVAEWHAAREDTKRRLQRVRSERPQQRSEKRPCGGRTRRPESRSRERRSPSTRRTSGTRAGPSSDEGSEGSEGSSEPPADADLAPSAPVVPYGGLTPERVELMLLCVEQYVACGLPFDFPVAKRLFELFAPNWRSDSRRVFLEYCLPERHQRSLALEALPEPDCDCAEKYDLGGVDCGCADPWVRAQRAMEAGGES